MRAITRIVLHTDGPCDSNGAAMAGTDHPASTIRVGHLARGFRDIGYHAVVRRDGSIELGRPLEQEGAHVQGHNADSIGIVCTGNGDVEPWTPEQFASVLWLCRVFMAAYSVPVSGVVGHREIPEVVKSCPGLLVDPAAIRGAL